MDNQSKTSTRKPRTPKAIKPALPLSNETETVVAPAVPAPAETPVTSVAEPIKTADNQQYKNVKNARRNGSIETVTSLNLRRTLIVGEDVRKLSFYIEDAAYTDLCALGMQYKLTWDEVLRGLVNQMRASNDPINTLCYHIPLLNS